MRVRAGALPALPPPFRPGTSILSCAHTSPSTYPPTPSFWSVWQVPPACIFSDWILEVVRAWGPLRLGWRHSGPTGIEGQGRPMTLMSLLFLGGSGLSSHSSLIPGQWLPRALGGLAWGGSKNQGCRKWAGPVQLPL